MLGYEQLAWIAQTLAAGEAAGAEFLVMTTGVQWHLGGAGSDSWGGFALERQRLTDILTPWHDRMIMLQADLHALAIDDGANNPWGGFPLALLAPLDANPSAVSSVYYNQGTSGGVSHSQFGMINVQDRGDSITVQINAHQGTTVLFDHAVTVSGLSTPVDPVEPEDDFTEVVQAAATPTIKWYAYDLLTLRKISSLQGATGDLIRSLGASESSTVNIPTPLSGPMANRFVTDTVKAPNTIVVAEINKKPAWAGIVWKTVETSEGGLDLGVATIESYLDRRYTRTLKFTQIEQAFIMRDLAKIAADITGIPLEFDITPTGIARDRTYNDDEDATLYKRIQELSEVINGPEWMIRAEYADEWGSKLRLIFTCRAKIGAAKTSPRGPISTRGGSKAKWKRTNDWSEGNGANSVIAYSSGEGDVRPQSKEMTNIREGYPRIEYRYSPSSSVTKIATLNEHATSRLDEIGNGTESIEVESRWDQSPVRLGIDIDLGDWVSYALYGPTRPNGLIGIKRLIGWKLSAANGTFTPVFLEETEETLADA
nr:hypothetical protein GCM10025732_48390 [Glycomyces mayteni]